MDELQFIMCPACGCKEIEVIGNVVVKLFSDNGNISVAETSKTVWDGDSEASCNECNWYGKVADAIVNGAPTGCLTVNRGKEVSYGLQMPIRGQMPGT